MPTDLLDQDNVPLPFVVKTWSLVPSDAGSVHNTSAEIAEEEGIKETLTLKHKENEN
jgi:hypothetical protein